MKGRINLLRGPRAKLCSGPLLIPPQFLRVRVSCCLSYATVPTVWHLHYIHSSDCQLAAHRPQPAQSPKALSPARRIIMNSENVSKRKKCGLVLSISSIHSMQHSTERVQTPPPRICITIHILISFGNADLSHTGQHPGKPDKMPCSFQHNSFGIQALHFGR